MTIEEYNTKVWAFYMRLEKDFMDSLNYVEFSEDNYLTYSIEFEKQLLSICSEVDVLCKLLCNELEPNESPKKIYEYAEILCQHQDFSISKVRFDRTGIEISPFSQLSSTESPSWWKAYNKIKHQRTDDDNYKQGNLKNVFEALSGLYMLNRFYCKHISTSSIFNEPTPKSQLFKMVGWQNCIPIGNSFANVLHTNGGMSLMCE